MPYELIRHVQLLYHRDYELELYDTHEQDIHGKHRLYYRFTRDREPIFTAGDFWCSPSRSIDSDDTLVSLLGFLTLRPGDTDAEYFENYTPRQLEFAANEAEELSIYADTEGDKDRFIDILEW